MPTVFITPQSANKVRIAAFSSLALRFRYLLTPPDPAIATIPTGLQHACILTLCSKCWQDTVPADFIVLSLLMSLLISPYLGFVRVTCADTTLPDAQRSTLLFLPRSLLSQPGRDKVSAVSR